jgi:class 3 adenylate cyclase
MQTSQPAFHRPVLDLLPFSIWALHIALPAFGLWLLLAEPKFDITWENHTAHFWLVAGTAGLNIVLALLVGETMRRHKDARLVFVSLMFLTGAGFLFLHALATPAVILEGRNAGFVIAAPVGLMAAAVFALASSLDFDDRASASVMRFQHPLEVAVVAAMTVWAAVSLLEWPPLDEPLTAEETRGPLIGLSIAGGALYGIAALRYYLVYRRRPAVMLIGVITAFALLTESMVAQAIARNWHASWWEWHLLMTIGFLFVAYSAAVHYRREGAMTGLFRSVSLEETVRRVREDYNDALESLTALVGAYRDRAEADGGSPIGPVAHRVGERFGLTPGQVEVLERAAGSLAGEREQVQKLSALVAIGHESSVILEERQLLDRALSLIGGAFKYDSIRLGLLENGDSPVGGSSLVAEALESLDLRERHLNGGTQMALPITVKGAAAGVLEFNRAQGSLSERDTWLLRSLASQLSIALENARLYQQIDGLFRQYMSSNVATVLIADPDQAALGGAITEVTVLFADLRDYTAFSETSSPQEVVRMLNAYYGIAAPIVLAEGGTIDKFVGDAMMAVFNAPIAQPDHALRAARAALALQQAVGDFAEGHPRWPRFRVGINTGPALIGNIGSDEIRNFTAIGDAVNTAARLESSAASGEVIIGADTFNRIRDHVVVDKLDPVEAKGKREAVVAYRLKALIDS